MAEQSSKTSIVAALIGNLLVALAKGIAAAISGSSAMLSEAIHSFVDSGNEILLLYGQHRAARLPDHVHPLGYGREIYFWSFIVALLVFALGAVASVYEGVVHIRQPEAITDPRINFAIYGASAVFEGVSWWFGWNAFQRIRGDRSIFAAVHATKDPTSFMVLFEDTAALIGIAIAATATLLSLWLHQAWIDGAGSVLIGLVLALVAILLARETKALLIGEKATDALTTSLREVTLGQPGVRAVKNILTSQLSPDQVIANLSVEFDPKLSLPDLEELIGRIEANLHRQQPDLFKVFVRPTPVAPEDTGSGKQRPLCEAHDEALG